jgi:hypothetical protein
MPEWLIEWLIEYTENIISVNLVKKYPAFNTTQNTVALLQAPVF